MIFKKKISIKHFSFVASIFYNSLITIMFGSAILYSNFADMPIWMQWVTGLVFIILGTYALIYLVILVRKEAK